MIEQTYTIANNSTSTALQQYLIHARCMQMSLLRIKDGRPMSVGDIVASVEEVDDQVEYYSHNLLCDQSVIPSNAQQFWFCQTNCL